VAVRQRHRAVRELEGATPHHHGPVGPHQLATGQLSQTHGLVLLGLVSTNDDHDHSAIPRSSYVPVQVGGFESNAPPTRR
jgi:hypothetical protein